jgi:hypothetical protein
MADESSVTQSAKAGGVVRVSAGWPFYDQA